MMLALMLGSALGARVLLKVGFRTMGMVGYGFMVVGTALLTQTSIDSSQLQLVPPMICVGAGLGIGFITPPLGLNLFVISGLTGQPVLSIAAKAVPFVLAMLMVALLLAFVPQLSLFLVR